MQSVAALCEGMEASWEWLCITEVIFKEILSKKYSFIYIFPSLYSIYVIDVFLYVCYVNIYFTCPKLRARQEASPRPARVAPGRLSCPGSQTWLSGEPCYSQVTQGVRMLSPNERSRCSSIQQSLIPWLCLMLFSPRVFHVFHVYCLSDQDGLRASTSRHCWWETQSLNPTNSHRANL